jgi:hypothetical protein
MAIDIIGMIEGMAEHGHAPTEGCSLFGVGQEDAFARIQRTYLERRFGRGNSAEKFVIGPYGSGKTHFLHQLMELGRAMGCVTAEVMLNKDLDFTRSLNVYREVIREIRAPETDQKGIRALLDASLEQVRQQAGGNAAIADQLVETWIAGLDKGNYELEAYGRVVRRALEAHRNGDAATFDAACRWLEGDVGDKLLARELFISTVDKSEENVHGRRALLSLFQIVRRAKFRGTVLTFDEAEQGLAVDRKRMDRILSMLQSGINAVSDLKDGSVLVVYALTPELFEHVERFAALQQRVADPGKGQGFFDGNTLAPIIDLAPRTDLVVELRARGRSLVDLAFNAPDWNSPVKKEKAVAAVDQLAEEIGLEDVSSGSRREMVRRTCTMLVRAREDGELDTRSRPESDNEDEV